MPKADRIAGYFPSFYRAADRNKLLYDVIGHLAHPLEEADTHLFRIQRAHRLRVVEQVEDLLRLAAALNLTAFHFEDLLNELYEEQTLDYEQALALMRDRVERIARVHLAGLGTPWAVMQCAAIFLNATIVSERTGDPLIKHLDDAAYSHVAVIEFPRVPERPRERVYLHENPFRRRKKDLAEHWPMDFWVVQNRFPDAPVRLAIRGVEDRTVRPRIFCPQTGETILFNGVIPDGQTLVIDAEQGALLEDQPVDAWIVYSKGGLFNFSNHGAPFVREQADPVEPFSAASTPGDGGPLETRKPVPSVPLGRSTWYFTVAEGRYDAADFDYAVFATEPVPDDPTRRLPIGTYDDHTFDQAVFDYPPSGIAGMAWDERIACTFKLLLPAHLPGHAAEAPADGEEEAPAPPPNPVPWISSILPRFKAAGVQAYVDTARDAWILGQSVLRDAASDTDDEGIAYHATYLRHEHAELLVPFEPEPTSS